MADVVITDDGLGTNNLTVTGADAGVFEVDSSGLYIKAGTILDFETKTSYSVTVEVDDADGRRDPGCDRRLHADGHRCGRRRTAVARRRSSSPRWRRGRSGNSPVRAPTGSR